MLFSQKLSFLKKKNFSKVNYFFNSLNMFKQPKLKFFNQRNRLVLNNNEHFLFQNSKKNLYLFEFWKLFFRFKITILTDIICIDYIKNTYRFNLIYNCINIKNSTRFFFKFFLKIFQIVQSISPLFKSSTWLEREIWDMYGIFFENNQDLRRILTDYGFIGFPLRKNFPLLGFFELRYDFSKKSVIFVLLELTQEFRNFDFELAWNNTY